MGILEALTLIFITLKLMGVIAWSWLAVLSPVIFSFTLYLVCIVMWCWSRKLLPFQKKK